MVKAAAEKGGSKRTDMSNFSRVRASHGQYLYFAYGSNIHVAQMAERCPRSLFVGTASLSGFRWQINQRGVANVVRSKNDCVEGLVYLVDAEDERRLDRSEGVSSGYYQKHLAMIDLIPHRSLHKLKTSLVSEELEIQRRQGQRHTTASPRGHGASLSDSDAGKEQTTRRSLTRSSSHGSLSSPPPNSQRFPREPRYFGSTRTHQVTFRMAVALLERAMSFISLPWRRNNS